MHGRAWVAPPESALLFSLLLFPPESLNRSEFLTAWSAVAVAEEIRFQFGLDGRIKWPNDVRIDDRKLCGILVERRVGTVVGIGLNVATRPEEFPVELRGCATSMRIECGREIDRTELAADLLFRLDRLYQEALDVGPISVWERWSDLAEDLAERPIVATTRRRQIAGRLLDVRPDRGARVVLPDGSVARIPSEELVRIEINRDDEW
jgi:BirA family biotin operon repressor/biotin-[acetyl-CoA-carboxylase] ligase